MKYTLTPDVLSVVGAVLYQVNIHEEEDCWESDDWDATQEAVLVTSLMTPKIINGLSEQPVVEILGIVLQLTFLKDLVP